MRLELIKRKSQSGEILHLLDKSSKLSKKDLRRKTCSHKKNKKVSSMNSKRRMLKWMPKIKTKLMMNKLRTTKMRKNLLSR